MGDKHQLHYGRRGAIQIRPDRGGRFWPWAIALVIVVGIGFRLVGLSNHVFWVDEVATAIRISGYTKAMVIDQLATGQVLSVSDLQRFQHPPADASFLAILRALTLSPEHAPLYFLLASLWVQAVGSSVAELRSLSVLLSLVALPGMAWLCWELFGSNAVGWMAVSLMAVSPFFVAYAQEARPYSLWAALLLLSGAALVRALRLQTGASWALYSVLLLCSLYTSVLTGLVLLGQGLYVVVIEGMRLSATVRRFGLAAAGALLGFTPWIGVIVLRWSALNDNVAWARVPMNALSMGAIWLYSLVVLFFDLPVSTDLSLGTVAKLAIALGVLAVIGRSLVALCTRSSNRVWLFVLATSLPSLGCLMAIDMLLRGQASATPRYLLPLQLGVLLAIAYWLIRPVNSAVNRRPTHLRPWAMAALLALSLISCVGNLNRIPNYQKAHNRDNPAIAAIINRSISPRLIAEAKDTTNILSLSHSLEPAVTVQILPSPSVQIEPNSCHDTFLFSPSPTLQTQVEHDGRFRLEPRYQPALLTTGDIHLTLWQLYSADSACGGHQEGHASRGGWVALRLPSVYPGQSSRGLD